MIMSEILTWLGCSSEVQKRMRYEFKNINLLKVALTHKSHGPLNSEKLEFLGDSVLSFLASILLHSKFPSAKEGELSRMKALVVGRMALCDVAKRFGIPKFYCFGESKTKLLSDALESLVGAVFLDGGLCSSYAMLSNAYVKLFQNKSLEVMMDSKSFLQEKLQHHHCSLPSYSSSHSTHYRCCCLLKCQIGLRRGVSIRFVWSGVESRVAEQTAATGLLTKLLVLVTLNSSFHQRT